MEDGAAELTFQYALFPAQLAGPVATVTMSVIMKAMESAMDSIRMANRLLTLIRPMMVQSYDRLMT